MLEGEKLAYLVGIIEGEGTIAIAKQKPTKGRKSDTYSLRLQVANTSEKLMDWLEDNFGGSSHKVGEGNEKNYYAWILGSKDTYKLLKLVRPYFLLKGEQADLGIEFYNLTIRRASRGRVPGWLNTKREKLFQKMKSLHL